MLAFIDIVIVGKQRRNLILKYERYFALDSIESCHQYKTQNLELPPAARRIWIWRVGNLVARTWRKNLESCRLSCDD
jgi:hypothetical protein